MFYLVYFIYNHLKEIETKPWIFSWLTTIMITIIIMIMMMMIMILIIIIGTYKFTKSQEKINHLLYMDDIKISAKNKKESKTLIQTIWIYSQDIGMEFGKWEVCYADNKKWLKRNNERNRTAKSEKHQNTWRKKKITSSWEYWKWTLSNKQRWKENKRILQIKKKTT